MSVTKTKNEFSVRAYAGDAKTLLAFNLPQAKTKNLAGFTIQVLPKTKGQKPYYLLNTLKFKDSAKQHFHDPKEKPNSTVNAPYHKFRYVHVPGSFHQGQTPFYGPYEYTVTPRYFDNSGVLKQPDDSLSVTVAINVQPFVKGKVELGFTRGFVQSQAFEYHFGSKAPFRPAGKQLIYDTSQKAGTNNSGEDYTFLQEYTWSGFTARTRIFDILNGVLKDKTLHVDVFAYDLNEPDIINILLKLAAQGRVRIVLDNAPLHHSQTSPTPEDQFEKLFIKAAKKGAAIVRGKFGRYAHDKVFIVSAIKSGKAIRVLTGSTNFSYTGMYVNSNHVLVFNDATVASAYQAVFNEVWSDVVVKNKTQSISKAKYLKSDKTGKVFPFKSPGVPKMGISFSPHDETFATQNLDKMAARIKQETKTKKGSVLFAVMGLATGTGPIYPTLRQLHSEQDIYSYGISDSPGGIFLYKPGRKNGALVTGKPIATQLPPPFNQVKSVGKGHQIHHKFVVCGFNGANPVVYCGSSNLALTGEEVNGDNLLVIEDADIATVFAIEALELVDHFNFLDNQSSKEAASKGGGKTKRVSQKVAPNSAGWFLSETDKWTRPYYDKNDLHCTDRELFA